MITRSSSVCVRCGRIMFYYPLVLRRHSGCFSTIWLVATSGKRVTRGEYLGVNVETSCDDLMNFILGRVPGPAAGLPRPRFSLYLSSQLQYGIVKVFTRQCGILLGDIQLMMTRLQKMLRTRAIDLEDGSRAVLALPDALSVLQAAEGASDPLFGRMTEALPSPTALMEREILREASPRRPDAIQPEDDFRSSQESITMKETQPLFLPTPEFEGAELEDNFLDTVDILLAQSEPFTEGDPQATGREETADGRERRRTAASLNGSAGSRPLSLLQDIPEKTEDVPEVPAPELPRLQEALLKPEKPEPADALPTGPSTPLPPPLPPSLPPPLLPPAAEEGRGRRRARVKPEDASPPEERRRRRSGRQLVFADLETQLAMEELEEQIRNPQFQTRTPKLLPPPRHRRRTAAELLDNPCCFLPEEILRLWRAAATATPLPGSDLMVGERGDDPETERTKMATSELEKYDVSDQGLLPLEVSDQRDQSGEISPVLPPGSAGSAGSRPLSLLQDIPEKPEDVPEVPEPELPRLWPLAEPTEPVVFQSLFPPDTERRTVAESFLRLLGKVSSGLARVQQEGPYKDILVSPGSVCEDLLAE